MEAFWARQRFEVEDAELGQGSAASAASNGEVHVTKGDVSLCFLVDEHGKKARVIDFRAGHQASKLDIVRQFAEARRIERVFAVVEREEAANWAKLGFKKEASLPGFYKRSDGHVMGLLFPPDEDCESGSRIRIRRATGEFEAPSVIESARRIVKNRKSDDGTPVKVAVAREKDAERALEIAKSTGRALTNFAPFSRDVEREARLCTARGGFSLLVGVELQRCFGSVFLEPLVPPRGEKETFMIGASLSQICADLARQGFISAFAFIPAHSVELSASMLSAGFRPTGELQEHLTEPGQRVNATAWAKKLGEPT
jgi:hypothetical protein